MKRSVRFLGAMIDAEQGVETVRETAEETQRKRRKIAICKKSQLAAKPQEPHAGGIPEQRQSESGEAGIALANQLFNF